MLATSTLLAQAAEPAAASGTPETILFWVFAVIAVGAGLAMVAMRNIVHAALMLVLNFFAISALFLGLQSPFLSIVQIIVYAGAIMVLFLFVIMLLGVDRDDTAVDQEIAPKVAAAVLALAVVGSVLFSVVGTFTDPVSACGEQRPVDSVATFGDIACVGLEDANAANAEGSVGVVGERLFTRYTFAFELAAVLLTVATLGAMVLGRRHDVPQDDDAAWVTDALLPSVDQAKAILAGAGLATTEAADDLPVALDDDPGADAPGSDDQA